MQKALLFLLLVAGSITTQAQSLKELLYGGKLKMDSNAVLRKTDDLKSRIDTGAKRRADSAQVAALAALAVDSAKKANPQANTTAIGVGVIDSAATTPTGTDVNNNAAVNITAGSAPAVVAAAPPKSNNKIWKDYTDSLANVLKAEVLPNKKIKKETYYLTVAYEIDTDGKVTVANVTSTPENALLQSVVKQRIEDAPPALSPVLDSANKPRKVKRNQNFSVTKE